MKKVFSLHIRITIQTLSVIISYLFLTREHVKLIITFRTKQCAIKRGLKEIEKSKVLAAENQNDRKEGEYQIILLIITIMKQVLQDLILNLDIFKTIK